jgi:PTH1 family peptidyl-tRNA hydrolase
MDTLAQESGEGAWAPSCQSLVREARWGGQKVLLAKPLTFMNLSGRAVRLLCAQHGLGLSDLILVLDDLNLPLGRIRIREKGSAGGHNGMESVLRALESDEVARVRLGVGEVPMPDDKAQFVLSEFAGSSAAEVDAMVSRAKEAVVMILTDGIARAMSVFNA